MLLLVASIVTLKAVLVTALTWIAYACMAVVVALVVFLIGHWD